MLNRYFLTDLDFTLLRSNATLSSFTLRTVTEALEQGICMSYATARSYTSSQAVVSAIPWKYPFVLYNGAMLFDPVTATVVGGHWLDGAITNDIIQRGKKHGLTPLLFCLDADGRERVLHEKLQQVGYQQFYDSRPGDPRFRKVDRLQLPDDSHTLIVTYIGLMEELELLRVEITQQYGQQVFVHLTKDSYIANHYFLEFSHPLANKREGLRLWAKLVGCSPEDVTVFGDNLNDKGMFLDAGKKIAVANAHPDILQLADEIVGSNDADGVATYIRGKLNTF